MGSIVVTKEQVVDNGFKLGDKFPALMRYKSTGELYLFFTDDQALIVSHETASAVGTVVNPIEIYDSSWEKAPRGTSFKYTV